MSSLSVAGIDFSMSCPSITFHYGDDWSFDNCTIIFKTDIKKYQGFFLGQKIYGTSVETFKSPEERYYRNADDFVRLLKYFGPTHVGLEDYAFSARGRVFHIGENTGLLKYGLWANGYITQVYAPTEIKKFATGSGKAKKTDMYEAFKAETGIDLVSIMNYEKAEIDSPIGDIVDSYFICKYIHNRLKGKK